jgi:hypothetical protein
LIFKKLLISKGYSPEISQSANKLHGVERSPTAVVRMVEGTWFEAIKGSSLDRPAPKRNAYAMAKAGVVDLPEDRLSCLS